jgi:hypothetical protein
MKRIFVILITLALLLTSCNPISYIDWESQARQKGCDVLSFTVNSNTKGIKELISANTLEHLGDDILNEQINVFFDYFKGNIQNIRKISISGGTGTSYGKYEYIRPTVDIYGIKTDTGHSYDITIHMYILNVNEPKEEGIYSIYIKETHEEWNADTNIKIGE